MNLAVIPARGGSKRIPRKNIREFRGKPIIAYSIETALESGCFDRVLVRTDDDEIAELAERYGADVPFRRPAELSNDFTPTIPVIRHAIETVERDGSSANMVCCIYATAPFVKMQNLRDALNLMDEGSGTEFAFSATTFDFSIFRALKINEEGLTEMFWPENELVRSQDLPEAYHDAGQFYWGTREAWMTHDGVFSAHSRLIVLPKSCVQDIDTADDWARAERLHELLNS